jgi:hypothetical protein
MSRKRHDDDERATYFVPQIDRPMTEHEAFRLAGLVRNDMASVGDARELITQFVSASYTTEGPSRSLLFFVRDALAEYLECGKSLESAFRLKKGRAGRPNTPEKKQLSIAAQFLRRRIVIGESYEDAAQSTAESANTSRTVIAEAFRSLANEALNALMDARPPQIDVSDPVQRKRVADIFPDHLFEIEQRT